MTTSDVRIVVAGAGAFGGWAAHELRRRGAAVTLIDAWGPGNARSSSGGETRVIRATYGTRTHYTDMALRALARWREYDAEWGQRLLRETGVLWMFGGSTEAATFASASGAALAERGAPVQVVTPGEAAARYPQVRLDDVQAVIFEPKAGYLLARRACEHVAGRFEAMGGVSRIGAAVAPLRISGTLRELRLTDDTILAADAFVFACGPWLPALFPDVVGGRVAATRQEVHYFGEPAGASRFTDADLPAWIDFGETQVYGIPGNSYRGFKLADDTSGPPIDPTSGDRLPTGDSVERARKFLRRRFPALAEAPLLGSEVCQYESSPDADFIIDRHPCADNVWIAGGGSGHGFKMGPVVGEMLASAILDDANLDSRYALGRFMSPPPGGWQPKWT